MEFGPQAPSHEVISVDIKNLVQLGAVVCGQKGLKNLTESGLNLIKLGVEPRLGILSFVGGEMLGRQLLQMQIYFVVFYICFEVDSIDL